MTGKVRSSPLLVMDSINYSVKFLVFSPMPSVSDRDMDLSLIGQSRRERMGGGESSWRGVLQGEFAAPPKLGERGPKGRRGKLRGPHWRPPQCGGRVSRGIRGRELKEQGRVLRW